MSHPLTNPDGSVNVDEARRQLDAASAKAARAATEDDARHAAFHGLTRVSRIRVEARPGYRGRFVCRDCYHGKEWDGR